MRMKVTCIACVLVSALFQAGTAQAFNPNKDPGLEGWWKLDETSGTAAADSSGKGRNGTINGNPVWATGKIGGALTFDGSGDYVMCNVLPVDTAVSGGVSVCAWINKTAGGDRKICSNRQVSNLAGGGFSCSVYNDRMEMDICSATVRTLSRDAGGPTVPANTWVHLAWVYDDAANEFREYHNGVLVDSDSGITVSIGPSTVAFRFGCDSPSPGYYFVGSLDDLRVYTRALKIDEIQAVMTGKGAPELASSPRPSDGATDIPRDTSLTWKPGEFAAKHDVYFGANFDDVNTASRTSPKGVLANQNQDANSYDPTGVLEYGKMYYWRIDEVNAPPTSTVFKGDVWKFTVEPVAYQVRNITATASSEQSTDMTAQKTVDGSGLNAGDQHGVTETAMWLSSATGPQPTWIQYQLDNAYKLQEMWVWNFNQTIEPFVGWGIKIAKIEYSTDGANWTQLTGVADFTQATGLADYVHNTTVNLGGLMANYVRITANSNWGIMPQFGLSEVRFFQIPVQAREPYPVLAQTAVPINTTLRWRAGREAATHKLYISTSKKAVREGTVTPINIPAGNSMVSYGPMSLDLGKTYFWRVDEVNEAATPSTWAGTIWSFTTFGYVVVDEFEDYNDSSPKRIFQTWIDGFGYTEPTPGNPGNGTGSTVGNLTPPFAERTIIHGGSQAMRMGYDNTKTPYYSEAERTFTTAQDWTALGVKALTVWFRGIAASTGGISYNQATDTYTIKGSGSDIWSASDQFHFAYKQVTGDCTIIARIDSLSNTDNWAKAGVMIRETLDANSPLVDMSVSPQRRVALQWRTAKGVNMSSPDSSSQTVINAFTMPRWVKLTRTGNQFTAQHSSDGVNWIDIVVDTAGDPTYTTVQMAPTVYIGLVVTSHNTALTCEAKISKVTVNGVAGAFTTSQDIGITSNVAAPLYVSIADSAGKTKAVTNTDPNAVLQTTYREWNIPLTEFSNAGVNLKSIKKLVIGVGNKASPAAGGTGRLYVDDIRLYPARCLPTLAKPGADVSNDCMVDYKDLDLMADAWLLADSVVKTSAPASTGLAGYWKFDGDVTDSSGKAFNGTIVGTPSYLPGKADQAILLDNGAINDQYVNCGTGIGALLATGGTGGVTVAAWGNRTMSATDNKICGNMTSNTGIKVAVYNNRLEMEVGDGTMVSSRNDNSPTMSLNTWYHVAVVFDDVTDTIKEYINGVLTTTTTAARSVGASTNEFRIGTETPTHNTGRVWKGLLDELRVYNRALSPAEIGYLGDPTPGDGEVYGAITSPAELYSGEAPGSRRVNLSDFAKLAQGWLEQQLWP